MAHSKVTKTYSQNTGVANTFSYSGNFDVFKGEEVVALLDNVKLTFTSSTINESASPREYTVDTTAKTIHIGGANLSSGSIIMRPETDMGEPTAQATFSAGSSVTAGDLNNNQLQLMRKAIEYDDQKLSSTGGTMTGDLTMGQATTLIFEGATDDAYETTLTVADPSGSDKTITLPNTTGTVITTGDTGTVTATMLAANSVDSSELVDGSIDTSHIGASQVTTGKIANDAITGALLADDAVDSEHYTDGSIDTAHIADSQVTADKLASNAVTAAKINADAVTGAKIADDSIDSEHYADGSIDDAHLATNSVSTVKIVNDAVTIAKIGCEQTTISDSDSHLPTSGAVVDYVAAQIAPIGGFEVIADDESFPNTIPAAGVVISITDAAGLSVNSSGVSTNGDALDNSTITINGFPSELRGGVGGNADPYVFAAGAGLMVQSTGSSQTYNYHQAMIREADFVQLSDDINDFNSRYRIGTRTANDSNTNDDGDLFFDTGTNKMYVYDGAYNSGGSWGEVTSVGEFKILGIKDNNQAHDGTGPTFNGTDKDQYDLFEGTNDASITQAAQLIVSLNGVIQKPNDGSFSDSEEGFYLDGADGIRFCDPPPSGSSLFVIKCGSAVAVNTPADNSVTGGKLDISLVQGDVIYSSGTDTLARLAKGTAGQLLKMNSGATAPEWGALSNNAVATAMIADDAVTEAKLATLGDVRWADNGSIILGAGSDGLLFSDGSNGFYRTGGATGTFTIQSGAGTPETIAKFIGDGAVELYYNNVKEIETKSGGVKLLGHSEQAVNALGNTTGSTTIDFSVANIITATLTGNATFANPTTESVGQSGSIIVTQDGTGSRTLAWGTQFKWTGGTAPTLTTTANAVDRIDYLVVAADTIHCVPSLDVK